MDNLLWKTRCYLAGAMEYFDGETWRDYTKNKLKDTGIVFLDPYHHPFVSFTDEIQSERNEGKEARDELKSWLQKGDFDKVAHRMKLVRADDLRCVDVSDFFIFHITPTIPTFGTIEELTTANRRKAPIFMWIDGGKEKCPLWILGMIPHKYIYSNLNDVIITIKNIDSGKKKIDSDRWRLLQKEYR